MLTAQSLVGAWTLLEWQVESAESGRIAWPFGRDAEGLIVYSANGWMSATLSERTRTALSAASMRQADEATRARVATEYLAYSGRWSLEGETVVHRVTLSLNPVLIGTEQRRRAELAGSELTLSASETDAGKTRIHRLRWLRP